MSLKQSLCYSLFPSSSLGHLKVSVGLHIVMDQLSFEVKHTFASYSISWNYTPVGNVVFYLGVALKYLRATMDCSLSRQDEDHQMLL